MEKVLLTTSRVSSFSCCFPTFRPVVLCPVSTTNSV